MFKKESSGGGGGGGGGTGSETDEGIVMYKDIS